MRRLKRFLYKTGMLGLWHRVRNRRTLTVVMFHRVLPDRDARAAEADPLWTVSDHLFVSCLEFFRRHYNVVSLDQLRGPLPDRALLITFDDGWADNEEYALDRLATRCMPAVVFVVATGVGQPELWQESLRRHARRMAVSGAPDIEVLIDELSILKEEERRERMVDVAPPVAPHMLNEEQIRRAVCSGITIGSHGVTHSPIPRCGDMEGELAESRERLAKILPYAPAAFSFPHGEYDDKSLAEAFRAGYEYVFTSDAHLNRSGENNRVLGRIAIHSHVISEPGGRFCPELLALWLFRRQCAGKGKF